MYIVPGPEVMTSSGGVMDPADSASITIALTQLIQILKEIVKWFKLIKTVPRVVLRNEPLVPSPKG